MDQDIISQLRSIQTNFLKENRNTQAYLTILTAIKQLVLAPGESYLERELADALNISRTPVREAFSRLEMESWGQIVPRKGFKVEPIHVQTIQSIAQIMSDLDGLTMQLACLKIDQPAIARLEEMIKRQKASLDQHDLLEYINIDDHFHTYIKQFCPNSRLINLCQVYSDQMYRARLFTIDKRKQPNHSIIEHEAILSAIEAKDEQAARQLVEFHRQKGSQEIIAILKNEYIK